MAQNKPKALIDQKVTLAEVRARIGEIKPIKKIEGKGAGATVRSGKESKAGRRKARG